MTKLRAHAIGSVACWIIRPRQQTDGTGWHRIGGRRITATGATAGENNFQHAAPGATAYLPGFTSQQFLGRRPDPEPRRAMKKTPHVPLPQQRLALSEDPKSTPPNSPP